MRKSDFTFMPSGYGHYKVTYTSPNTGKMWTSVINDMELIDLTYNELSPKKKDLDKLKFRIKNSHI